MLVVNYSSKFIKSYKKLPNNIQEDFDKKIIIFMTNPKDHSLNTHKLKGKLKSCLSFYLYDGYRVLFEYEVDNSVNLLDIGPLDKCSKWRK
jgi:mRNA-degrading endonuclease RelE of RelBE toxin-antitoxin system